jgi:xylitol oxidase
MSERNWAGNHRYAARRIHRPRSVEELQELVAGAGAIKALGTRHCFNDIADFPGGELVDLAGIDSDIEIASEKNTVTVGAATRYGDLARPLHEAGHALPNLASLPHCTVAGSVATATHGSGQRHGGLATTVSGLTLLTADGELRDYSRQADPHVFPGLVVGLGALGVVTRLTLDLVPAFELRQDVYEDLPWDLALAHFDELQAAAYSVSLFTDWTGPAVRQVWLKSAADATPPADLFGARPADGPRHPVPGISPEHCTEQGGVPGPWYDRLPHFRLGFTPSAGEELQTEYLLPRRHAVAALEEVRALGPRIAPLLAVSEVRTVAADDLWLSPCHGEDCVAIHFTWLPRQAEVSALLPEIERRLAPYRARPHWGKLFHAAGEYPRLADFRALADHLDPTGAFRNPFLARHVFGAAR